MSFDVEKNKAWLAGKPGARCAVLGGFFLPTPSIQHVNSKQCQLIVLFKNTLKTDPEKILNRGNFRAAPAMT